METQLLKLLGSCVYLLSVSVYLRFSEALLLAGEIITCPIRFWVMVVGLYRQARHTRRFELYISFLKCTCTLLLETSALCTCSNKYHFKCHKK